MHVLRHQMKPPTYHRQRFQLFLLEAAGGTLSRMDLQKLIFLHEEDQRRGHYHFVPYQYGAYSFQCADDLLLLEKRAWVQLDKTKATLLHALSDCCGRELVHELKSWLKRHPERGDDLVRKSYLAHPYHALNSKMKQRLLSAKELRQVAEARRVETVATLQVQTIGYEGISFETYLNRLILNGTATLWM